MFSSATTRCAIIILPPIVLILHTLLMGDSEEDDDDAEGYSSYEGERSDDSRPHGHGVATFGTFATYDGLWVRGRPAGQGRFTFLGGRSFSLNAQRPTAPDYMKSPGTLGPGYIWPCDDGQGRRELVVSGVTYTCSTERGRVCLKADATATREQGVHLLVIVAESVIDGRCRGLGRLEWALANGNRVSYEGQLQGTAKHLALMHGQVSSHAHQSRAAASCAAPSRAAASREPTTHMAQGAATTHGSGKHCSENTAQETPLRAQGARPACAPSDGPSPEWVCGAARSLSGVCSLSRAP